MINSVETNKIFIEISDGMNNVIHADASKAVSSDIYCFGSIFVVDSWESVILFIPKGSTYATANVPEHTMFEPEGLNSSSDMSSAKKELILNGAMYSSN